MGAWRKVYRQFRGAILANISYVIITIALHVITQKNYEHILPQLTISLAQKAMALLYYAFSISASTRCHLL
uniref:AlNc14C128G6881 protein n=1 Tax=Albugo laibachii Nc14 TaxID=890382 RepID=F0WK27_9STRA|nr:AlNc14C128G6881 [Albugo laibachii Nc14]|eukprot:CCA21629.1 AlNc14C128G6881 [Albugo laibachii Nc14]